MAAELDFHAASVCTPLASHFAIGRTLIELGKQVLCESPHRPWPKRNSWKLAERHKDLRVNYNQLCCAVQKLKEHLSRNEQVHLVKIPCPAPAAGGGGHGEVLLFGSVLPPH